MSDLLFSNVDYKFKLPMRGLIVSKSCCDFSSASYRPLLATSHKEPISFQGEGSEIKCMLSEFKSQTQFCVSPDCKCIT